MSPTISGIAAPPRFTRFELSYLLAGRDDPSAQRSREVFGIPEAAPGDPTAEAGASSLVARGLIEERQGTVLPRNEAGLVGYALGTARHWVSVVVRTSEGVDVAVVFQGDKVALLGRGAPAGTLDFVPVQADVTVGEVVRDTVMRLLSRNDVDIMVRSAGVELQRSLYVRVRPEGLGIGRDPVFPGDGEWPAPDLEVATATRGDVESALDEIVDAVTDGR